jgi:hypothetical protein
VRPLATQLDVVASRLFSGVMAPLVLGGAMRPGHAIGARTALALRQLSDAPVDAELESRVQAARVRRARELVPIDRLDPPTGKEWTLAAALHDILQAVNPNFDTAFRRGAAARILNLAEATMDQVGAPANVLEALSRHTWFARMLEVTRMDTEVSWWTGSRTFRGVSPSRRLQAWPKLRRVSVARSPHTLAELAPLAVDREQLLAAVDMLLASTPLTDIATCSRRLPPFAWTSQTLAFVATVPGRTLSLRALARLPAADVDLAIGRATHEVLTNRPGHARSALMLLADRAIAQAEGHLPSPQRAPVAPDAAFARRLSAAAARHLLAFPHFPWSEAMTRQWLGLFEAPARVVGVPGDSKKDREM